MHLDDVSIIQAYTKPTRMFVLASVRRKGGSEFECPIESRDISSMIGRSTIFSPGC